jgi:hypothetical protein
MSVLEFKPEVWSKVILAAEKKALVYGGPGISNSDYEGEISGPGNTVHITQFGDPQVSNYDGEIEYQELDDAGQQLLISQKKYFAFVVDDVDKRQAAGDMQAYLEDRGSYQMANTADQYLASYYTYAGNVLNGSNGSSSSLTVGNEIVLNTYNSSSAPADFYLKVMLPLQVQLDQALVPANGRYIVVPPWADALVRQTAAFIAYPDSQGEPGQVMAEGRIGRVAGFDIYKSMNAVEYDTTSGSGYTSGWVVQAGHPMALTFAEQIVQTEALRLQTQFGDAVRCLHVYGAKLVRPDHIAVAGVGRPSGI